MDITPTRRKQEDDGQDGEGDGSSVSTSAPSESTLHQSVSSTWTQARFSEGPDPEVNPVPTVGQRDGHELKRRPLDPHKESRTDTTHQHSRPPLPSMANQRSLAIGGSSHTLPDDSDHESTKNGPKLGTAAPNSSPCPTSHLAMPDIMSSHDQAQHEPSDSRPRDPPVGPNTGSSLISPSSQSSARTRLPAYLVSDSHDIEVNADGEQTRVYSLPQSSYVAGWTPPSSPSFPDSDSESVSSFPSVNSSFFFSSAGASPHLLPIYDANQPLDDRHASGSGAPTRRRSRQALQPGGHPRTSSRAHSRRGSGPTSRVGHASQSSLENLPHSQKPIPLADRKGGAHARAPTATAKEPTMDLAIPTLSLPSALPRPTQFGQTLGRIKVVLLSDPSQKPKSDATSEEIIEKVMQTLIWDNEDIVDAGEREMIEAGSSGAFQLQSLHASTDWLQPKQSTTHSQPSFYSDDRSERFEGNENVEIVRVLSMPSSSSLDSLTARLKRLLVGPFHQLSSLLLPSLSLSIDNQDDDDTFDITSALARLLASSDSTPLFTALVVVVDPAGPSDLLKPLLRELSSLVPIVILSHGPSAQSSSRSRRSFSSAVPRAKLSAFSPNSLQSLLVGLFRAPETLKTLRMEAVERFLKWREVEGEVARSLAASSGIPLSSSNLNDSVSSETQHPLEIIQSSGGRRVGMGVRLNTGKPQPKWQEWKQQWETEWMESFSVDVASRLKEERGNEQTPTYSRPSFKVPGARKHLRLTERKDTDLHGREVGGDNDRPSSPSALIPTSPLAQSTTLPTDPLHLPSLIFLSLSLLGPLKQRLRERIKNVFAIFWDTSVPLPGAISTRESHSCKNCGFALPPVTRREHEIASRSINHGNRRLVLVGIGGLLIGVGIGLCAR